MVSGILNPLSFRAPALLNLAFFDRLVETLPGRQWRIGVASAVHLETGKKKVK